MLPPALGRRFAFLRAPHRGGAPPPRKGRSTFAMALLACAVGAGVASSVGAARPANAGQPETEPSSTPLRVAALEAGEAPPPGLGIVLPPAVALPGYMISPGKLAKAHSSFDTTDNCTKCHPSGAGSNKVTNALCTQSGCHANDIGRNIKNKSGFHGRSKLVMQGDCGDCHDDHRGLGFDLINDKNDKAEIPAGNRIEATPWAVAMQTAGKPNAGAKDWNHDLTGYKLIGGHKIDCDQCHKPAEKRPNSSTRTFLGTDQECLKCHDNYHNFPKGDKFEDCLLCHTFFNWNRRFNLTGFDHDKTDFPLRGAHAKEVCTGCHPKGKPFAPVAHDTCETCHARDSVHGNTFTTKNCVYCHNEVSWRQEKVVTADHEKFAKFDAKGAHARLPCVQCHKGLKTTPPKAAENEDNCTACHNNIHGPSWVENQAKGCLRCHTNARWAPVTVDNKDHKSFSEWSLFGPNDKPEDQPKSKHLALECVRCHRDLAEVPPASECITCHVDWHATLASVADKPGEKPVTRGTGCSNCHGTAGWETPSFNHDTTDFPLTGKHRQVTCEQCHKGATKPEEFQIPTACNSCHGDPHLGRLPKECEQCHETVAWEEEKFDHNEDSDFKLVGKHLQVDCYKCHLDLGFRGTPERCADCHLDYHKGAWGPIGCEQCHNERRWAVERGTLVFQTLHNFGEVVLTGVHESLECETCHAPNPRWLMSGMGGECNQCHPDVHMGGRGQECHTCHNQRGWLPAEFNHTFTGFPLTGTHRVVACVECHRGNVYTGTPDDCAFCHADDAQQIHGLCDTVMDCLRCHNTVRWSNTGGIVPSCVGRP